MSYAFNLELIRSRTLPISTCGKNYLSVYSAECGSFKKSLRKYDYVAITFSQLLFIWGEGKPFC